jgi:RNA polymerase sigma factor (TIGR02999 family)
VSRRSSAPVSELLAKWRAGDEEALRDLVPLIYQELHRLAHRYLQRERPDHTLQSTALVHEAYLRLSKQKQVQFQNRSHFFAVSAQLMRQILVDYAKSHRAAKRGGGTKLSLEEAPWLSEERGVELVLLDDALNGLARLDPQQSRIVELRFFGGLSIEETAEIMGISPATVKRHWATARLWLQREMKRAAQT